MVFVRRVHGQSMQPTLRHGQLVLFRRRRQLQVGDIVMLHHLGRYKLKRVVSIRAGDIYVRGDNPTMSTDSDDFGWVPRASVFGSLVWPRRIKLMQRNPTETD